MSDEQIERYYDEFLEIPTLERQRKLYTFETYCKSRRDGWSKKEIKKYFKMEV